MRGRALVQTPVLTGRLLEVEPQAGARDTRVHDLEYLIEAGRSGQAAVVLATEHRAGVEHVEQVEVEVEARSLQLDQLAHANVERLDFRQAMLTEIGDEHALASGEGIHAGPHVDAALEPRLAEALPHVVVEAEVDIPARLIGARRNE